MSERSSLLSQLRLGELLARFDEPISPRFYRQVGKLRCAAVVALTLANLAGSLAIFVAPPTWDITDYLAHQAVILGLGGVEIALGWAAWRAPLGEIWQRRLVLAASATDIALVMVALHTLGSVSSHMISLALLLVVLYRLVFDLALAGATLGMTLTAHWTLVVLESQRWLRPQIGLVEIDAVYREPSYQLGTMAVITGFYVVGFVMAHWAVLRLRRREVALRVLRETFAAVDPERVGELTGAILGARYEVRELLGRGGSSEVYAGMHLRTRRPVAIKVLAERLANRAESLARFRREAEITGRLHSPAIVEILDVDEDGGYPFLVLELLRGRDLRARVRDEGPLSVEQASIVATSLAAALDAAHAAGIVHRDLKPANVFLCESGGLLTTKLLDFGIARPESSGGDTITREVGLLGTPAFMAPEQLWPSHGAVSAATDVFALGATLYFALTGRQPYPSDAAIASQAAARQLRPEPPSALRPGLPAALDDVLLVAMSEKPEDRFATAGALAKALDAVKAAGPAEDAEGRRVEPLAPEGPRSHADASEATLTMSAERSG